MLEETAHLDFKGADAPDMAYLEFQDLDEESENSEVKKAFILDKGRLQLNTVKAVFNLATVELCVGELIFLIVFSLLAPKCKFYTIIVVVSVLNMTTIFTH
jgi:hypothetical protein